MNSVHHDLLVEWVAKTAVAKDETNRILAEHGFAGSRIYFLEDVQQKLSGTPVDVQDYFTEAIVCLQTKLYRSAIVVSWAGFFSIFCERLYAEKEETIRIKRSKWAFSSVEELKEKVPESQIIDVAKEVGLINSPKRRILDGWLAQRNQCAHPTVYRPSSNVGIGFVDGMVDEVLQMIK